MRIEQNNFTGGEASSLIHGRQGSVDRMKTMVKTMDNFLPYPQGPAALRPGTRFIASTKYSNKKAMLVRFVFSTVQAYQLEFGDGYIRFYMNQGRIVDGTLPYEIISPYNEADLPLLKFVQSADTLYIFHPTQTPRKLSRTGHTAWVMQNINFRPPATRELGIKPEATLTLGALSGSEVIFTTSSNVFQTGDKNRLIISGVGRASITGYMSPTEVTCEIIDAFVDIGPIDSGQWQLLGSPSGRVRVNAKGPVGAIIDITADAVDGGETFVNLLNDASWILSPAHTALNVYYLPDTSSDYQVAEPDRMYEYGASALPFLIIPETITHRPMVKGNINSLGVGQWAWGNADILGYNTIYVRLSDESDPNEKDRVDYLKASDVDLPVMFRPDDVGKYILILGGFVKITTFISSIKVAGECIKELNLVDDKDSETLLAIDWQLESPVWSDATGWPTCGCFYNDRLYLAGSTNYPQTIWGSVIGDYENFTPGADDSDMVEFTLGEREVNSIKWLQPHDNMLVGTVGGIWKMSGDNDGLISPLTISAEELPVHFGCSDIQPIKAGGALLYIQRYGKSLREITYKWEQSNYDAEDLTALADHITETGIIATAFLQVPFPVLFALRTDGVLIGITYVKSNSEYIAAGWFRWTTAGIVESISTNPGATQDELWMIVRRTIGSGTGQTKRYIEILEPFWIDQTSTTEAKFCDCGLAYSGVADNELSGLNHLEGETVNIVGDGAVFPPQVVAAGKVTLSRAVTTAFVGLPYSGKIELLPLEIELSNGSTKGRFKIIKRLILKVYKSLLAKIGRSETNLTSVDFRDSSMPMDASPPLSSGIFEADFDGDFTSEPRVLIVQDSPMPLVIESITSEIEIK